MKTTEVPLPDAVYNQLEALAAELRLTVPEVLRKAAETMLQHQPPATPQANGG